MKIYTILVGLYGLFLSCNTSSETELGQKEGYLNEPYLEWELENTGLKGNKYDVVAWAIFKHENGHTKQSLMFYSGDADTWKFRFTGIKTGKWTFITYGPGNLGVHNGTVIIKEGQRKENGFLTSEGKRWLWEGTNKATIPQLVMAHPPETYWSTQGVDTQKINDDIREFITETGFTGFHFPGGGGWWFNIHDKHTVNEDGKPIGDVNPDQRTFQVFEEFLIRAYQEEAAVHFWMWGSDGYDPPYTGPRGIGGPMSPADKRILRYMAARLGPLPGWSMGYGFDLHDWIREAEITLTHACGIKAIIIIFSTRRTLKMYKWI